MAVPTWKSRLFLVCAILAFLSPARAQQRTFTSKENNVSAQLPGGWDQVQGVRDKTLLKLARSGPSGQKARITLVLDDIPAGRIAAGFDMWDMTDEQIRQAAGKSFMGEKVSVLNVGRASIDGVHVAWNSNRRQVAGGTEMWEFVYEGIRGSQYMTVRLTAVGDKDWFESNQAIFADFVRSLR
ncbi:MAG TPA: hypothetical protein VNZ44_01860, partial [Pyrinomonadaceae bacterium]|nr:hypothetical protein [Pyrinomonadaceae bacterium]